MKKLAVMLTVAFLFGCAYGGEQLETLVRDPHFAQHQDKMDALEKSYLHEQISYSEYVEKKKQLEDDYDREVKERENIIHR